MVTFLHQDFEIPIQAGRPRAVDPRPRRCRSVWRQHSSLGTATRSSPLFPADPLSIFALPSRSASVRRASREQLFFFFFSSFYSLLVFLARSLSGPRARLRIIDSPRCDTSLDAAHTPVSRPEYLFELTPGAPFDLYFRNLQFVPIGSWVSRVWCIFARSPVHAPGADAPSVENHYPLATSLSAASAAFRASGPRPAVSFGGPVTTRMTFG